MERSPSLLRKKLNFTRLRLSRTNDTGTLEVNSAPLMRNQSGTSHHQSPFFASCRPGGEGAEASRDEASSFRQELERKFGFKQPQQQDHLEASQQEMSMIAPRSKRKAIVSSESEGEEAAEVARREGSDEDSDVFQTARSVSFKVF